MKLIKPSFEIIEQKPGLEGIYEQIELAGRTCYKSTRKEGTTAKDFVDRMIASGHGAMLEHGTVYLTMFNPIPPGNPITEDRVVRCNIIGKYYTNPYSKVKFYEDKVYITTNYRVLVENYGLNYNWLDDLQYLCEPTEFHEKRYTVRFITDIGVGRELLRHRVQQEDCEPEPLFSYANESTRYCNYSKDKFGNKLTFITPSWVKESMTQGEAAKYVAFRGSLHEAEIFYMIMLEEGATPEEARAVLPLATKSELVMTGFESDWSKVFDLRVHGTTGKPHPDCRALVEPVMNEFIKRGWYEV